ncbi:hypothetical protein ABPG72_004237 [Tetrahymena utriculariae]
MKKQTNLRKGSPQQKESIQCKNQNKKKKSVKKIQKRSLNQQNMQSISKQSKRISRIQKPYSKEQRVKDNNGTKEMKALFSFYQNPFWHGAIVRFKDYLLTDQKKTSNAQTNPLITKIKKQMGFLKKSCKSFNNQVRLNLNGFLKEVNIFAKNLSPEKSKECYQICLAIVLIQLLNFLKDSKSKQIVLTHFLGINDEIVENVLQAFSQCSNEKIQAYKIFDSRQKNV